MTMAKENPLQRHQMTIGNFERLLPNEDSCRDYLAANRWPEGVRCGNQNVHVHTGKPHHWNCYQCWPDGVGYDFSMLIDTIFENTNTHLIECFRVMRMMVASKRHLPLYINEFEFRYDNRMNPDIFGAAIRAC